jgi:aryl-alcohol dehydrogenase-like predicted oxidoreductase
LAGHIRGPRDLGETDWRRRVPRFEGQNLAANVEAIGALTPIAARLGASLAELALAWVLAQGRDVVPLFGTKRRDFLVSNLRALDISLEPSDLAAIEAALPRDALRGARYPEASLRFIG